ncbi:DUF4234 domain-containing protein [Frankia sp. AiPs1]|uniref:DUF4234 domain-containing protein n=1 Tax=Frankia sp. AiPa1 TaxID=573492 RepID=UPI00202AEC91|nr:DUF4234 domain-containing protein [Frankia sp. AiPa1]MCL9762695.1 DUF4234 domain-containing protein [Frankia sp. AiPa1]
MDTDEGRTTLTKQSATPHGFPEPHGQPDVHDQPGWSDRPHQPGLTDQRDPYHSGTESHGRTPEPHPIDGPGTSTGGFPIYAFRESLSGPAPEQGYPATPDYGTPGPHGPSGSVEDLGAGMLGKHRNPLAVWVGLPLITLGVYPFVWVYRTNRELAEYDQRIAVNPTLSLLAFLIGWVVIVPPFVAAWRLGARTRAAQHAAGVPETNPALAFVLFLIGFGPLFLQIELNRLWSRYPGAVEGQQVPLYR